MALQQDIAAALASLEARCKSPVITAPKAYAAHLAGQEQIEAIRKQHAEAIKSATGYSAKLGCFASPVAAAAFIERMRAE